MKQELIPLKGIKRVTRGLYKETAVTNTMCTTHAGYRVYYTHTLKPVAVSYHIGLYTICIHLKPLVL